MKKLKIIIDFETDILDELRQVGIMKSYTIEQTAGRVEMVFFKKLSFLCQEKSFKCNIFTFPVHYSRWENRVLNIGK